MHASAAIIKCNNLKAIIYVSGYDMLWNAFIQLKSTLKYFDIHYIVVKCFYTYLDNGTWVFILVQYNTINFTIMFRKGC